MVVAVKMLDPPDALVGEIGELLKSYVRLRSTNEEAPAEPPRLACTAGPSRQFPARACRAWRVSKSLRRSPGTGCSRGCLYWSQS